MSIVTAQIMKEKGQQQLYYYYVLKAVLLKALLSFIQKKLVAMRKVLK